MKRCIYCREEKDDSEFTLEHAIPQFLGGAYAPDTYKNRDACSRCNSNLGLFVDASFERSFMVSNQLRLAAFSAFDPSADVGLPLLCMGSPKFAPPGMNPGETCELWLGPLGEQVFWVRPADERLYWYSGGNPITTKQKRSRAYYVLSIRSSADFRVPSRAFRDSFQGQRVKKVMCTQVEGADPSEIGLSEPDDLDRERIEFFLGACEGQPARPSGFALNIKFDHRFLSKLALGVCFSLFGWDGLNGDYAEELYKGLRFREGDEAADVLGSTPFTAERDPRFLELTGDRHGVSILLMPSGDALALNLSIGAQLQWTVKCADLSCARPEQLAAISYGRVILLYRQLQYGIEMSLPAYLTHKTGQRVNVELAAMQKRLGMHSQYLANLAPAPSPQGAAGTPESP